MESAPMSDCAGRQRSTAAMADYYEGRPLRNRELQHPADPLPVEEIIAVMRAAGDPPDGDVATTCVKRIG